MSQMRKKSNLYIHTQTSLENEKSASETKRHPPHSPKQSTLTDKAAIQELTDKINHLFNNPEELKKGLLILENWLNPSGKKKNRF